MHVHACAYCGEVLTRQQVVSGAWYVQVLLYTYHAPNRPVLLFPPVGTSPQQHYLLHVHNCDLTSRGGGE